MKVLLDSVILIDHFNGRSEAKAYLLKTMGVAVLSVITRAEVLVGVRDAIRRRQVVGFLEQFPLLEITKEIGDLGADLRREYGWKLPDALQAALAQKHELKLATRNTKDFPASLDFVEVPYE